MGRRGAPAKRKEVKIAEGTYRADRDPVTLTDIGGRPPNPFPVERIAHRAYDQIATEVETLGIIGRIDLSHLVAYAESWELREQASADLQSRGLTIVSDKGVESTNPAFKVWSDATTKLRSLGNDLGCNANARSRIVVEPKKPKQVDKRLGFVS